ncbi:MAG: TetR/AcrR family transcriptional regulator [Thermanaerothrix sp.]|nr:TetR/AcrR family transcriptional regulator [Thermanaerothrix sp.]
MNQTKERILSAALKLFAQRGYDAVSTADIASSVGLTKGALYKHFKNKEDILNSVVARMEELDRERARDKGVPDETIDICKDQYEDLDLNKLLDFAKHQLTYWSSDDLAANFRRMITKERERNQHMRDLFNKHLGLGPLEYVSDIMAQKFNLSQGSATIISIGLIGPMYFFYELMDVISTENSLQREQELTKAINNYLDLYFDMIDKIATKINQR